ncbi:6708_t:CDS:2 [Paraglomus occultum]|uniref:Gamma-soluble NSF attachment protein n=1 Tax=Paraglomus occultum TaxID=144539 RepID=A0A9N9GUX5_9GLOM|nr:6708_t:CDS:2 [Paraglomus occultum]
MDNNKIQEAIRLLADGDKAIQKGFFKKPEWDVAGSNYERAANCFKGACAYEQAIQAYLKASDAMFKSDSVFMAAKDMESAANLAAIQLKQPERAADLYRKASDLYQAHMTPDRAAEMLEKGGRVLEPINVDEAIKIYSDACALYETEDRGQFAIDTFKKTIAVMVRNKSQADSMLQRLSSVVMGMKYPSHLFRTYLSIVIVLLAMNDDVEAKKRLQRFSNYDFVQSEEAAIAHSLITAFEQGDQDLLEETVKRRTVSYLDNEIAKLARNLVVPGGVKKSNPLPTAKPVQPPTQKYDKPGNGYPNEQSKDYLPSYYTSDMEGSPLFSSGDRSPNGQVFPAEKAGSGSNYIEDNDGGLC